MYASEDNLTQQMFYIFMNYPICKVNTASLFHVTNLIPHSAGSRGEMKINEQNTFVK